MLEDTDLIVSEVVAVLFSVVEQEVGSPRAYIEVYMSASACTYSQEYHIY